MQEYKIEISDLAEQDLEFATDYIAFDLKNPSAAINAVRGIRNRINKLQDFTYAGGQQNVVISNIWTKRLE